MFKQYLELAKPGIVVGNALAAASAGAFAFPSPMPWLVFFAMVCGISCVIGAACALNNIYDRDIDARMERTKKRPIPSGQISDGAAFIFAAALLCLGSFFLYMTTPLALLAALFGFAVYVLLYTPLKHKTRQALFVGALAGATPPVVGYTAATGSLDALALLLFGLMFLWQLPHFLSISVFRYEEYAAAGVPLFITQPPSERSRKVARNIFYASLAVLLLSCVWLMFQR